MRSSPNIRGRVIVAAAVQQLTAPSNRRTNSRSILATASVGPLIVLKTIDCVYDSGSIIHVNVLGRAARDAFSVTLDVAVGHGVCDLDWLGIV